MKKIAVITATRAESGLLMPVIKALRNYENKDFKVELVVTGIHLSSDYGYTISEIEKSRSRIDHKIPISVKCGNAQDISDNQAEILKKFTGFFIREQYNAIMILGDRYEMLAIAIAAGNTHTPIFHLCGGDTTEGAIDEWIRHSITKMSYLHFVTNDDSKRRVIQLGENPDRVFNFGSTSIDNIIQRAVLSKRDALASIGLEECRYAICTYHPVTIETGDIDKQIYSFLDAIKQFQEMEFIITKSNADQGGARINELLDQADINRKNVHVFASLGVERYLSLMKHSEFVLGNSSSGIIEAPVLHIPTVNIGDRQRGRLQAGNIINCGPDTEQIVSAIWQAQSEEFRSKCRQVKSPYGDGHAAEQIAAKVVEMIDSDLIDLKKTFYDQK